MMRTITLAKEGSDWNGTFDFFNKTHTVRMKKEGVTVRESLRDSRDLLPMKLDIKVKNFAWAAPVDSNKVYFVSNRLIYLAEKQGKIWKTYAVDYDTSKWMFYSIGLSPQQDRLIAHGSPKKKYLPTEGKGDYYILHLNSATEIDYVEHLPATINTDSYDIFPTFTADGSILLSSWGTVEDIEPKGYGDLYLAKLKEDGTYQVSAFIELNTPQPEAGAFMDHQGRFIIFHKSNREKKLPDRLFISERTETGWAKPQKMSPPVNRDFTWAFGGRIDPEGKYFFFNSGFRGQIEIFRVPVAEIQELTPFF